jgi:hypothetical protein
MPPEACEIRGGLALRSGFGCRRRGATDVVPREVRLMLFMCAGKARSGLTSEDRQNVLKLFQTWTPPSGIEIKAHYATASGGDYVIVEASSVEPIIEATAMWAPFIDYDVTPIIAIREGVGGLVRAEATRTALL